MYYVDPGAPELIREALIEGARWWNEAFEAAGFIDAFQKMQNHALDGVADVTLYTPFVNVSKADIVTEGARHGTPFAETWSCYKGGKVHCGRCGTCVERREAFDIADVKDPTVYADPDFWRQAVREA